jgi:hypothetical protein
MQQNEGKGLIIVIYDLIIEFSEHFENIVNVSLFLRGHLMGELLFDFGFIEGITQQPHKPPSRPRLP